MSNILEQIKHCQKEFKKCYNSLEGYHAFITLFNLMNLETQKIDYIKNFLIILRKI